MNEKTTLEIIAPTVEEAIAQGLAQLGLTADAVSVEVLDAGSRIVAMSFCEPRSWTRVLSS